MQAVERLDSNLTFKGKDTFVPFKRIQRYLETNEIDVFFGLKKTPKRTDLYHFLNLDLYQLNYVVAV